MWPPVGTTLVLSSKDHLLEDIKVTERGKWWPAAVKCSSAGSEGSGHEREEWSWVTVLGECRGASDRSQLGALTWSRGAPRRCRRLADLTVVLIHQVSYSY